VMNPLAWGWGLLLSWLRATFASGELSSGMHSNTQGIDSTGKNCTLERERVWGDPTFEIEFFFGLFREHHRKRIPNTNTTAPRGNQVSEEIFKS